MAKSLKFLVGSNNIFYTQLSIFSLTFTKLQINILIIERTGQSRCQVSGFKLVRKLFAIKKNP